MKPVTLTQHDWTRLAELLYDYPDAPCEHTGDRMGVHAIRGMIQDCVETLIEERKQSFAHDVAEEMRGEY